MYSWFNTHFKLDLGDSGGRRGLQAAHDSRNDVWDDAHPRPPSGDDYERSLLAYMTDEARKQIASLAPTDGTSLAEYRRVVGGAVDVHDRRISAGAEQIES